MWWGQYKYKYKNKYLHQVVGSVQIQIQNQIPTPGGGVSTNTNTNTRWWGQYKIIPWPDSCCLFISTCIQGHDERWGLKIKVDLMLTKERHWQNTQGAPDATNNCSLPDRCAHTMPEDDQHSGICPVEEEVHKDQIKGKKVKVLKDFQNQSNLMM